MNSFEGNAYRLADNWFTVIPTSDFETKPIKYLEIGVHYGANLISVCKSYAKHPDSVCVAVDPWNDYGDYPEYKNKQESIYTTFLRNIEKAGEKSKVQIARGFSRDVVQQMDDASFDIIYIDGNHEPEFVLEDAVLCFRKLKVGGYLIFDDFGWGGPSLTQCGIEAFVTGYHKRIEVVGLKNTQVFCKKTLGYDDVKESHAHSENTHKRITTSDKKNDLRIL